MNVLHFKIGNEFAISFHKIQTQMQGYLKWKLKDKVHIMYLTHD